MRVFWPTTGITREHGVALGWKVDDTLCVVTVVPDDAATGWPNCSLANRLSDLNVGQRPTHPDAALPQFLPIARVSHAASPLPPANGMDLTILSDEFIPVCCEPETEVILYTPDTSPLARLTLGEQPTRSSDALSVQNGYARGGCEPVDFERLLRCLNLAGTVQALVDGRPLDPRNKWLLVVAGKLFVATVVTRLLALVLFRHPHCDALRGEPRIADTLDSVYTSFWHAVEVATTRMRFHDFAIARLLVIAFAKAAFTLLPFLAILYLVLYATAKVDCRPMRAALRTLSERQQTRSSWPRSILFCQLAERGNQLATLFHDVALPYPTQADATTRRILGTLEIDWLLGITAAFIVHSLPGALDSLPRLLTLPSAAILADPVTSALQWLNAWPVGLKLNTPLSEFMSSAFSLALTSWRDYAVPFTTGMAQPTAAALCIIACAGLSFPLALVADILQLATLHLRLCHLVTATLTRWVLFALARLWDLFRGKRWNVLRNRTDSHAYDVDALFLGTMLFTLTVFLAPTVVAYAALFASINIAISIAQRVLAISIAALNSSPVFEVSERLARPENVPAGIIFQVIPQRQGPVLELKSTPRSIGAILGTWVNTMTK